MICRDFERRLESWVDATLGPADRQLCERHLAGCARCRELARLAAVEPWSAPPAELASEALRRTIGSACGRARELLVPLVDGELRAAERKLLEVHLSSCVECREVRAVLAVLGKELPRLIELDPGPAFTEAVLARTARPGRTERAAPATDRRSRRRLDGWRRLASDLLPRLARRPRFAWEAAYVLALVLMPAIAFFNAPEVAAEAAEKLGRAGGATVASTVRGVTVRAAKGVDTLGTSAGSELRTFGARLTSSLQKAGARADGSAAPPDGRATDASGAPTESTEPTEPTERTEPTESAGSGADPEEDAP